MCILKIETNSEIFNASARRCGPKQKLWQCEGALHVLRAWAYCRSIVPMAGTGLKPAFHACVYVSGRREKFENFFSCGRREKFENFLSCGRREKFEGFFSCVC
eukprot:jgi/Botrbrau1/12890/Bobra.0299s0010.1